MASSSAHYPSDHPLPVRRVRFEYPDDTKADWIPHLPEFAYAANGLSMLMPHAEPLFIRAVRAHLDQIDPEQLPRVEDYIGQETAHYRRHRRFNELVIAQHPRLERVDRWMGACARWVMRRSDRFNLAFSAGGEMMAFLLARWVDRHASTLFRGAEPVPTTLFLWHLAEEVEHKSSAWDLYEQVDGSKLRYALAMVVGTAMLGWLAWSAALVQLADDGRLFRPVSHWRLLRWAVSAAFTMFPAMLVSALPGHRPQDFTDPAYLIAYLAQYDPETQTMPLWETDGRSAA